MTQEANKLKRKQDLKKYLVFALMFAVFAGSLWLIFAPSEKERKEQEQSVGFNTELPDPRNAGIVGDKKTAYEQDMMRRKQEDAHTRRTIFRYGKTGQHGTAVRAG